VRRCRKAKKLCVPELNKQWKHYEALKQHQKSNKNDEVKAIMGRALQMNTLRTGKAEKGGSRTDHVTQADSCDESSWGGLEETDSEYKKDAPDSEDDSNDAVLAFIISDE